MDTSFGPARPAGVTAVTVEVFTTVTLVAGTEPTFTPVVVDRFVPTRVIVVPPATGPAFGVTLVMVGAG
jgi:hypothetical protein